MSAAPGQACGEECECNGRRTSGDAHSPDHTMDRTRQVTGDRWKGPPIMIVCVVGRCHKVVIRCLDSVGVFDTHCTWSSLQPLETPRSQTAAGCACGISNLQRCILHCLCFKLVMTRTWIFTCLTCSVVSYRYSAASCSEQRYVLFRIWRDCMGTRPLNVRAPQHC